MIQGIVQISHREVQKAEEVNHVQDLVEQVQEEMMALKVLLKNNQVHKKRIKDQQAHKDMNKDQQLTLIMMNMNKILN